MIEISHAQARRWLRQSLDRHIPEGQWSALQGHLENCAECRAYRDQRHLLVSKLRRDLRAGWDPASLPTGLPAGVHTLLLARQSRRRALTRSALGLGVLLLLVGLLGYGIPNHGEDLPDSQAVAAAPTATATAASATAASATAAPTPTSLYEGDFRGVLAFEAPALNGQPVDVEAPDALPGDIFLLALNTGTAELTNLTSHPARDFAPAWSPDGNWLAFLSEREREADAGIAGADIYVISVAGTGLRRLTGDPALSWSSPLAWAPDGSWIAAVGAPTGSPDPRAERQIFKVDPEGKSAPRPLPGSTGGANPRFSPTRPILAFVTREGELTFLRAYHEPSGDTLDLTRASAQVETAAGTVYMGINAFDWTADGLEILYLSRAVDPLTDPSPTLVRVVPVSGFPGETAPQLPPRSRVLASFPSTSPVVAATLSPAGELFFTRSYRRFGQGPRCRPLATSAETVTFRAEGQPGALRLCIESGLDRASWTSDGRWMVVAARGTGGDELPGFYALALPEPGASLRVARTERLADLPAGAGTPRVRPTGQVLSQRPGTLLASAGE